MKIRSATSFMKQRRTWLIAIATVLVALLVLGIASGIRHAQIISRVDSTYSDVKTQATFVSTISKASRAKRLTAIKNLSKVQVVDSCKGEWWNAWYAAVLPAAKTEADDCMAALKKIHAVSAAATNLDRYLTDDNKVAKTLAVLKVATGSAEWQKTALSSAQSALRDIESITATAENKELLAASKEKTVAIINAWNALNDASTKQDKAAYLKAQGELAQAYANLGAISDVSDEKVEELVTQLQATTKKL